jgi:single-stranded-DNA-specific exonuclease
MMDKVWKIKPAPAPKLVNELSSSLNVNNRIATLLIQRGITDYQKAERFFRPKKEHLHDPFLMKNMGLAVERLIKALANHQKILVYGDYDVDGTTAVALMFTVLKRHHANIDFYIPDRYKEGYGLSEIGVEFAKENKFDLLITLDCGVKAVSQIQLAVDLGIDVIVCDHHEPGTVLPNAIVLDPKQKDCKYPFKELSGCGVGFKLMQALFNDQNWDRDELYQQLDLLALSIAADIVSITDENRVLAFLGLKLVNEKPRKAFSELLYLANKKVPLTLTDLVFVIAPRINAAGRLRSGRAAVQLMVEDDDELIQSLANEINQDNLERRVLDKQMTHEALKIIDDDADFKSKSSTVVFNPKWHKGVVGIVASRLIETHFKPTIVLTESNGMISGSARTVNDFDLHEALIKCSDLLVQFGGHTHAAGLSLLPENLAAFTEMFDRVVRESISEKDKNPIQLIDAHLSLSEIYLPTESPFTIPKFYRILSKFEPFGPGNMKPVFMLKEVYSDQVAVLKDAHLKLKVKQENVTVKLDAIGFGLAKKEPLVTFGLAYELACTFDVNVFRDVSTLQLVIKDIKSTDSL